MEAVEYSFRPTTMRERTTVVAPCTEGSDLNDRQEPDTRYKYGDRQTKVEALPDNYAAEEPWLLPRLYFFIIFIYTILAGLHQAQAGGAKCAMK